ncbi:MAG: hypothetical protein ABR903_00815 [Thermodesulfovibrionales bacterium]|jgi:hypothetical protein
MKRCKAIVSILFVFVLGVLTGALATHKIYQQRVENIVANEPKTMREFIVQRLNHELNLDSAQEEQLRLIVKETHAAMKSVRQQFRPQIEEILARSQERVRAVLRPDQLEKYEKIVARHQKKEGNKENSN